MIYPDYKHMMVDVEGLGLFKAWQVPVMEVGLVVFDCYGHIHHTETLYTEPNTQPDTTVVEPGTFQWWTSEELQEHYRAIQVHRANEGVNPFELVSRIIEAYQEHNCGAVWFAGPQYDLLAIGAYFEAAGLKTPWKYDDVRDFRTIRKQHPSIEMVYAEDAHRALPDAIAQVKHLERIANQKGVVWY